MDGLDEAVKEGVEVCEGGGESVAKEVQADCAGEEEGGEEGLGTLGGCDGGVKGVEEGEGFGLEEGGFVKVVRGFKGLGCAEMKGGEGKDLVHEVGI